MLKLQNDNDLVLTETGHNSRVVWRSATARQGNPANLVLENNGQLVLIDALYKNRIANINLNNQGGIGNPGVVGAAAPGK